MKFTTDALIEAAKTKLASVDWDFATRSPRSAIHDLHPYPARFIPQIPRELIRLFHPGDDSPVLDPFCGSGTTLVEAIATNLPAVGIDLNPLAHLISKVKTTSLMWKVEPLAREMVAHALNAPCEIPRIPRLDHWFLPDVQEALARLTKQISAIDEPSMADALKVTLSRIIVRVSNQDSDTRYAAVHKDVSARHVYDLFIKSAEFIDRAMMESYGGLFSTRANCKVINKNVLEVTPEDLGSGYGLVVTSPPYPNAYEYWLYHKYRMYWLGMDPIAVRKSEIGARPHYFKKNHQTEADFEKQMGLTFQLLSRVMKPGSFACFLVGRSVIHGRSVNNQSLLTRAAAPHGFQVLASIPRKIALTQKAFNPANSAINEEAIILFVLEGAKR